jgi:hypothetical protein
MTETITRVYDTHQIAIDAVNSLKNNGFPEDQISLVAHAGEYTNYTHDTTTGESAGEAAGVGAGVGGVLGAGAGLLTGLGIMAIPGVGPVVAAGWLVATAAGAVAGAVAGGAAGGIVGAMTDSGVPEEDAHVYAEGIRRGGSLVTVRAPESRAAEARRILDSFGPVDPALRRAEYRREGWERFDESAPLHTSSMPVPPPPPPMTPRV